MNWIFDDFKTDLDSLNNEVRAKALEIAKDLVEKKGFTPEEAIKEAIKRAEEWFYDLRG